MSSTSTPMSEQVPGTGYNPANPNPYIAPEGSAPTPPPITAPPQRDPSTLQQPNAPSVLPGAKGSKAATIAFGLDSVLRGYMKGREFGEQQKAYKANRLMQGFQFAYQNASQRYIDLLKNGVDPKSPEVQEAAAAADSAWTAQMKLYANHIMPGGGKKKSKGKPGTGGGGAGGDDADNPINLLQSQDPQEKARGYLILAAKAGPSYKYAAQQYLTPEYKKSRELAQGEQRITGDIQQKRIDLHDLQSKDPSTLDDKQRQRLVQLQDDPELFPSRQTPHYATFDTPGSSLVDKTDPRTGLPLRDKFGQPFDPKKMYRQETVGNESSWIESAPRGGPKLGSLGEFMSQWATDNGIDPSNIPVDAQQKLKQAWTAPSGTTTVRNGKVIFTDATGNSWQVPITTTTTRTPNAAPLPKAAPSKPPEWAAGATLESSAQPSGQLQAGTGAGATPTATPAAKPSGRPSAPPAASSSAQPTPPVPGAKLMGEKGMVADINAQNAMKDIAPVIDETLGLLEPHKGEGGWTDALMSHAKYWAYASGVSGSALQDKIKQLEGFIGIAGAAPWSKVGRGKYIFEQAQVHLPKPTDSPELAYHKLTELKQIYAKELQSAAGRARGTTTPSGADTGTGSSKSSKTFDWDAHPQIQ